MKKVDPSFSLPELLELVEHVVAPHIVHCYLDGNAEALKVVCRMAFIVTNPVALRGMCIQCAQRLNSRT